MQVDIGHIIIILGVILVSMTLHEAMHGFTAYWLGDDTAKREGRLTLNPVAHIDPILTILLPIFLAIVGAPIFGGAKPVPFNPYRVKYGDFGAALVGLAGPMTNFLIAFVLFGVYAFTVNGNTSGSLFSQILTTGIIVNLGFFVFNMIPIPPLDGSRILYALAPDSIKQGMEAVERYGVLFIFAAVMLFSSLIGQFIVASQAAIIQLFAAIFGLSIAF